MAILGCVAMLILIFPGLPSPLKTSFLLALSFALTCLGLAGSRHQAYRSVEPNPEKVIIESQPTSLSEEAEASYSEEAIIVSIPGPEEGSDNQSL